MVKDFTVCISIGKYPFAEMCVVSLQYFYPDIKILAILDLDSEIFEERKNFFRSRGIKVIDKNHNFTLGVAHAANLDELIYNHVDTKYCVSLDDDVFTYSKGVIEIFDNDLKNFDFIGVRQPKSWRLLPCYMAFKTNVFKKYSMTFKPSFSVIINGKKSPLDTGSFIFFDCLKYDLKINEESFYIAKYMHHLSGSSYTKLSEVSSKNLVRMFKTNEIPILNKTHFKENKFSILHSLGSVITNQIIKNEKPDFHLFEKHVKKFLDSCRYPIDREFKKIF